MSTAIEAVATPSKAALWTGRVLSALIVAMLGMSGVMKLMGGEQLTEGFEHLGWPIKVAVTLGIVELTCTLIYAIPQTAILGAVLLTGYIGGAIATHVRIGEPWITQSILGIVVWLALYLREPRLRKLLPLRM
jgi:hypothetical protein